MSELTLPIKYSLPSAQVMRQRDMNRIQTIDENNSYVLGDSTGDFSDENGDTVLYTGNGGGSDYKNNSYFKGESIIFPSESLNDTLSSSSSITDTSAESLDDDTLDGGVDRNLGSLHLNDVSEQKDRPDDYYSDAYIDNYVDYEDDGLKEFEISIVSPTSTNRSPIVPMGLCSTPHLIHTSKDSPESCERVEDQPMSKRFVKVDYVPQGQPLAEYDRTFTLDKLIGGITPKHLDKYPPFYDAIEHSCYSRTDESVLLSILDDELSRYGDDENQFAPSKPRSSIGSVLYKFISSFKQMKLEDYYKKYPWERYFDQNVIETRYDQGTGEFNFDMLPSDVLENQNYFKRSESTSRKQPIPFVVSGSDR